LDQTKQIPQTRQNKRKPCFWLLRSRSQAVPQRPQAIETAIQINIQFQQTKFKNMKELRKQMLSVKFSKSEYEFIMKKANEEGLTLSEFMRKRIFEKRPERNTLFEERAMRILTALAAHIQFVSENEMSDEDFEKFNSELKEIREKMGVID
jgi:hypothetical protein